MVFAASHAYGRYCSFVNPRAFLGVSIRLHDWRYGQFKIGR